MKTWTPPAESRLETYLNERTKREGLEGEDATELKDDLRRHIYEEAEQCQAPAIGLMQLESLLSKLDAGYRPAPETPRAYPSKRGFWIWTTAVFLPITILLLEATTGCCSSTLFDPIPTWWHIVLIALVPLLNAWLLLGCPKAPDERSKGIAAGIALVVSAFYGLLFLPVIHFSLLGLIFFGLGIVPLTPPLTWFASWWIGRRLKSGSASPSLVRQGRWIGASTALLALTVLEAPSIWTRFHLINAINESDNSATIASLRTFHSERTLLAACYEIRGFSSSATDIAGWISYGWSFVSPSGDSPRFVTDAEKSRDIFFRVTGKPFNSLKPPVNPNKQLARRGAAVEEITFDDHLGGDDVAIRLRHLDLKESRFDGHVDSQSRIGYGEWTMVFHNAAANPLEARCLVRLPDGGRVSRLTLWVNGEPREAAFNTVSKVKAAYKEIAVVQRRDPVLVTMAGPDTILVQCFPVPARGDMKIRFGITAPLHDGSWELPSIIERNFGTKQDLEHAVWLQGDRDFHIDGGKAAVRDGEGRSLSVSLPWTNMTGSGTSVLVDNLPGSIPVVWCEDQFAKIEERILIREPRRITTPGSGKLVMVIDGSASLADQQERIASMINSDVIAILADDTAKRIDAKGLAGYRFTGGRDNEPALLEAIRLSKEQGGLPVVWIHGPQSADVTKAERLAQLLERGTTKTVIHTIEGAPGPNRLTQTIYRSAIQKRGPDFSNPEAVSKYLDGILHGSETNGWIWKRSPAPDSQQGKVWDQLARLWAIDAAENPLVVMPDTERSSTAARYQLVTSVSGAVVLETAEQFAKHGLTPVDANAAPHIPSVPEPSTGLLVIITTAAALMRRKR